MKPSVTAGEGGIPGSQLLAAVPGQALGGLCCLCRPTQDGSLTPPGHQPDPGLRLLSPLPSPTSLPTCPRPGGQLPAALAAGSQVSLPLATRRKLFELARAFSEKTKMRKSKRKHLLKHQSYPFQPGTGWQRWVLRVLKTLGWTP